MGYYSTGTATEGTHIVDQDRARTLLLNWSSEQLKAKDTRWSPSRSLAEDFLAAEDALADALEFAGFEEFSLLPDRAEVQLEGYISTKNDCLLRVMEILFPVFSGSIEMMGEDGEAQRFVGANGVLELQKAERVYKTAKVFS